VRTKKVGCRFLGSAPRLTWLGKLAEVFWLTYEDAGPRKNEANTEATSWEGRRDER